MKRQIVLVDVTAMAPPNACIAGIDLKSGATVRVGEPQPTEQFVATAKLRPFDVIEIDYTIDRRAEAPHAEDAAWTPRSLRHKGSMDAANVTALLHATAFASVVDAFGTATVTSTTGNHGWSPGGGVRSLATVSSTHIEILLDGQGRIRVVLTDASGRAWEGLPFQDLAVRHHATACPDCKAGYLRRIQNEFAGDDRLVRVGLTRPYAVTEKGAPYCWLQITNIIVPRAHF